MQFYFPLITNSNSRRKTGPFFLFHVTNLTAFGKFSYSDATDEFLLSTIAIQKQMFDSSWLKGRCEDEVLLVCN